MFEWLTPVFRIFDFKFIEGSRENPFPTSNSILLTENTAKNISEKKMQLEKMLKCKWAMKSCVFSCRYCKITAPEESSIKYNALIPFSMQNLFLSERAMRAWFSVSSETYVLLKRV
jgi:putative ABC transport system permease protein